MNRILSKKSLLIAGILLSQSVYAGNSLRLRVGKLNTADIATNQLMQNHENETRTSRTEYIVQFKKLIQASDRQWIEFLGGEIFGYLPDDALVVRASYQAVQEMKKSIRVNAVVNYDGVFKISPDFSGLSILTSQKSEAVVVKAFKSSETEAIASTILKLSPTASIKALSGKLIFAVLPQRSLNAVASLTGVEHVQPNPKMEIMYFEPTGSSHIEITTAAGDCSDLKGMESGTEVMRFPGAWNQGFHGNGQIVSMADTGLDSGDKDNIHVDFANAVKSGYAVGLFGRSWLDPMGHGTHVAGSVLGRGTACNGQLKGGAYESMMVVEGMWSPMLNNLGVPSKLSDMFLKAYTDGARIHTNSWGSPANLGAYDSFAIQVDEFMSAHPDMLIMFAAGNSGEDKDKDGRIDPGSVSTPGTAKNALTVGASENVVSEGGIQKPAKELRAGTEKWGTEPLASGKLSDNANGLAMFSSRGPALDGRLKPEIVAPGTNILSVRTQQKDGNPLWGIYNKDYAYSGGTSMATPLAAGAASVAREILVKKWKIANPSAALLKGVLMHTAVDMFPGQYGLVGVDHGQELATLRPNNDEGYGRTDVTNVVELSTAATTMIDNQTGIAQGESTVSYDLNIKAGQALLANLVYTDQPGSPNSSVNLVNDLDLILVKPDGSEVASHDKINNHEVIELKGLSAGNYRLKVTGTRVVSGKQAFALIFSLK